MTYSIVARDPQTGQMGVAVQSRYFAVGAAVPWGEPGVGVVATQSFVEVSYGPRGLARMREGEAAPAALDALLAEDSERAVRQVAMLDASGRFAVHTGERCIREAGSAEGDQACAQANMMERDTVWHAMVESFSAAEGDLADRLMAALVAAEAEGGDIRGRQSAAMLVVGGSHGEAPWRRLIDLRVDDHPDPLGELQRLLQYQRAVEHLDRSEELHAAARFADELRELNEAAALLPDEDQIAFWRALALATQGRTDKARSELDRVTKVEPRWPELLRRLPEVGQFPDDAALLDELDPPG